MFTAGYALYRLFLVAVEYHVRLQLAKDAKDNNTTPPHGVSNAIIVTPQQEIINAAIAEAGVVPDWMKSNVASHIAPAVEKLFADKLKEFPELLEKKKRALPNNANTPFRLGNVSLLNYEGSGKMPNGYPLCIDDDIDEYLPSDESEWDPSLEYEGSYGTDIGSNDEGFDPDHCIDDDIDEYLPSDESQPQPMPYYEENGLKYRTLTEEELKSGKWHLTKFGYIEVNDEPPAIIRKGYLPSITLDGDDNQQENECDDDLMAE